MEIAAERAYPTPVSNSPLLPFLLLSLARQKHSPDTRNVFADEYDYIIVGAGSAGSVVASRLSDLPCINVLLLEAGHEPPLLTEVPVLAKYFFNSDVDWRYKSVPQKYAAKGYVNRKLSIVTGKVLGGSSSINFNFYGRGNRKNYDDWEDMGATGWNFNKVYPYFLKLEDFKDPEFFSDGYHAFGGPITVERPRYEPKVKQAARDAAISLGYEIVDPTAANQTGFHDPEGTLRDRQRCGTAKAYLVPVENRTNLDIVPNAMVTKVLIENGRATGVQVDFQRFSYQVKAKREVILSAGAFNTPQILKLSGVGPKEELERLNIPVVADLPGVGENLQSHPGLDYPFVLRPPIGDLDERISFDKNIRQYINNRTGLLSSLGGFYYAAFLKGLDISPLEDFPNLQLFIGETTTEFLKSTGLRPKVFQQRYGPYEGDAIFNCVIGPVQPESRGTVTLQSNNPYDPPLIDLNYLADFRDVEVFVEGLKACRRLIATEPFRRIGATPLETPISGCEGYACNDDEYLRCQAKTMAYNLYHNTGTAKMGNPYWDQTTVVDPYLRVKNIEGLRVVDASVMPRIISGYINIPTIMIAEKASDIIKEEIECFGRGI